MFSFGVGCTFPALKYFGSPGTRSLRFYTAYCPAVVLDEFRLVGNMIVLYGFHTGYISLNARRTCALGPAVLNKLWAPMAADHSARGSMKTGVKPETVCELQDTNDHRQVERKWRLPISVGKLSALEGRLMNLHNLCSRGRSSCGAMSIRHTWCRASDTHTYMASSQVPISGVVS